MTQRSMTLEVLMSIGYVAVMAGTAPTVGQAAPSPIAEGAEPKVVAEDCAFTEGPASDAEGNVYFTDQPSNRILKWTPNEGVSVWLSDCGRSNGLCFDARGRLWACADERNELWTIAPDGTHEVVVSGFGGHLLNGPNDVWVAPRGGAYFTDPYYQRDYWTRGPVEQEVEGVYYLPPGGADLVRVVDDLTQPNGLIGTPDGSTLYVADIGAGKTYVFAIGEDGLLREKRLFCEMGSDGMTIDSEGNVYLTGKGVTVFDAGGQQIAHIDIPEPWTANVCFGGPRIGGRCSSPRANGRTHWPCGRTESGASSPRARRLPTRCWMGDAMRAVTVLTYVCITMGGAAMAADGDTVEATLNGLDFTLDSRTGAIVRLAYDGPGELLVADPDQGAMVDVAYPIAEFEPLRLAARFSTGARIEQAEGKVTVSWDRLGPSRGFDLPGAVAATVTLTATPDGRSIIMTCHLENHSERPVRQVLFPDLSGLLPVEGEDYTYLKTGGFGSAPFRELKESDADQFYAQSNAYREYTSGGMFQPMVMRWMDLGGLRGGLSLFPRLWGWDPRSSVLLHLSETTGKLRLMCVNPVEVAPGATWESPEWVLTAHRNGWAKGLEPYREFALSRIQRKTSLPKHVREGLGYRSVWMCQNQPGDPAGDAIWRFSDLPDLAREAKEHGLTEMVLWGTHPGFELPFPPPYSHLGTMDDLVKAVEECHGIGVNVAPFISVLQANKKTGPRYGLTVPETGGWTYHTELIPRFNPPYAGNYACAQVDTANPTWQEDVLSSCRRLIEMGISSISWDQFLSVPTEPNIPTLVAQIRAIARERDPESTFSGEELYNIEVDCEHLDYTWNWGGYLDCQAYTSAFPFPRRNININRSVREVKRGFMDNLYLNVWPTKPGGVNGSDRIESDAALSEALKQCAALRAQFLPYFTDGTFIGYCALTEPCPEAVVCSYVLPDRMLLLVMNEGSQRAVTFGCDVSPWMGAAEETCTVRRYGGDGALVETSQTAGGPQRIATPELGTLEITAYEVLAGS